MPRLTAGAASVGLARDELLEDRPRAGEVARLEELHGPRELLLGRGAIAGGRRGRGRLVGLATLLRNFDDAAPAGAAGTAGAGSASCATKGSCSDCLPKRAGSTSASTA